jgi:hypothetical protein
MGIEEDEVQAKENIFNKIIENSPNVEKETFIQVQETFRTPNRQNKNKTSTRHITVKTLGIWNKGRILKGTKEKLQVTYKDKPIRITIDFSAETKKATRKTWNNEFQALKENNCQHRLLYPAKLS